MATLRLYSQPGCAPCLRIKPSLTALAQQKGIRFEEVNISEDLDRARALGIIGVPVAILYKGNDIETTEKMIIYEATQESTLPLIEQGIEELLNPVMNPVDPLPPDPAPSPMSGLLKAAMWFGGGLFIFNLLTND